MEYVIGVSPGCRAIVYWPEKRPGPNFCECDPRDCINVFSQRPVFQKSKKATTGADVVVEI